VRLQEHSFRLSEKEAAIQSASSSPRNRPHPMNVSNLRKRAPGKVSSSKKRLINLRMMVMMGHHRPNSIFSCLRAKKSAFVVVSSCLISVKVIINFPVYLCP